MPSWKELKPPSRKKALREPRRSKTQPTEGCTCRLCAEVKKASYVFIQDQGWASALDPAVIAIRARHRERTAAHQLARTSQVGLSVCARSLVVPTISFGMRLTRYAPARTASR